MSDTRGTACGIYPLLLKNTRFLPACEWHDEAYTEGSWHQQILTRKQVDLQFLHYMRAIAYNSKHSWFHLLRANLFYRLSRIFGGWFWEGKP